MRKATAIILAMLLLVGASACGKSAEGKQTMSAENSSLESVVETEARESSAAETESENTVAEQKVLIAYFSVTHTTEGVAQKLAEGLQADLYEITPEDPYTDADIDYHDNSSRSTIEMNDPSARPEIAGSVSDMEQYEVLFLGYPIWWGDAPRIIDTFVESYDLSGKTIIPFCTSASSGIGSSAAGLESLTSGANWLEGTRFNGSETEDEILAWAKKLPPD